MKGAALLDTMARQVAGECESALAQARAERDSTLQEARDQSSARRESTLQAMQNEMAMLDERWRVKGEAEASKAALSMQHEAVGEVLKGVENEIARLVRGLDFVLVLDALLGEVMAVAPADVVVLSPESQVLHVQEWLGRNGHSGLEVQGSPVVWDGVAVQDAQRTFRISNTLTGRYTRVEQEARKQSVEALFDGNPLPTAFDGGGAQHG